MINIGDIVTWEKKGKQYKGKVIALNPANESLEKMEFNIPCARLNYMFSAAYDRAVVSVMTGKNNNLESIYAPALAVLSKESGTRLYQIEGFVNDNHVSGTFDGADIGNALTKAEQKGYKNIYSIRQL